MLLLLFFNTLTGSFVAPFTNISTVGIDSIENYVPQADSLVEYTVSADNIVNYVPEGDLLN